MDAKLRTELKALIQKQFDLGINKKALYVVIEAFIDKHYPSETIRMRHNRILYALAHDIYKAGGLDEWKEQNNLK